MPIFFKGLFKSLDSLLCVDENGISSKSQSQIRQNCEDMDHSLGTLNNHFSQFQKYFCNFIDEQVNAAKMQAASGSMDGMGS